jgi:hypothetical protein
MLPRNSFKNQKACYIQMLAKSPPNSSVIGRGESAKYSSTCNRLYLLESKRSSIDLDP